MNRKINVLVADDNNIIRTMLVDALSEDSEINIVGEAIDGNDAIEKIKALTPDLVLLDLIMPKVDGIGVMENIKSNSEIIRQPKFIVISAAGSDEIVGSALALGASYFFIKPFDEQALVNRVKQLFAMDTNKGNMPIFSADNNLEVSTENKVINLLRNLGVPVKMVGYKYLRDAIILAVDDIDALMSVTKNIYPEIADINGTSPGNVERNIRYVIESTWNRQEDPKYGNAIAEVFKNNTKKPTNSEFILICAEWINLNN